LARTSSQFQPRRAAGIDPRDVPWIVTLLAFAALCVAWLSEYAGGLQPCELCIYARYAYWVTIALGLGAIFLGRRPKARKFWLTLVGLGFLAVVGISIFHVGVEQGWWQGSSACVGQSTAGMSTEELTNAIMNAPVTRCDEPAFTFLGISMAGYDGIYAALLAWFTFWGATRRAYR
jgi:disulfide bond formation protein DsbB